MTVGGPQAASGENADWSLRFRVLQREWHWVWGGIDGTMKVQHCVVVYILCRFPANLAIVFILQIIA
jgi:hypothetical protein